MDRETVFSYTAGCYSGEPASCTYACPFRLDMRSFLKKCAKGRWTAAYKELRTAVLFPTVTAALCPRPCEAVCQRRTVLGGDAVAVGLIERACLDYTKKREAASYVIPPRTERVAVVGAGAAGLSCALLLAQKRFAVTVYDVLPGWGGALRKHADFAAFDADFALQFSTVDVQFRFETEITGLNALDGYDAVFVATGEGGAHFGLLESRDAESSATTEPRVFLGGGVAGLSLVEGMAQAAGASQAIEAFLQSGSSAFAKEDWDRSKCTRYAPHPDTPALPRVQPSGSAYTEPEAAEEAARCMQCDCDACMDACELLARYRKRPPRINNDVFMDGQGRNSVSTACITRQTWSCNLCGRCGGKCREGVDLRGLFQLSRSDRVSSGRYPPAIHDYWLREMAFAAGEGSLAGTITGERCAYAFFPGCRLGASNPDYVLRAFAFLRERYDAGILLNCCGVPAWWAGEDGVFQAHIGHLRAAWERMGRPVLVTACATCRRMLERFLPEARLDSLYGLLTVESACVSLPFAHAAVFDPCAAAGRDAEKRAVRALAERCGVSVAGYDSDGQCCGFGGHMQLADPGLYDDITAARAADADAPYIVYCANCREVFAAQGKECAHILDLVFGLERGGVPTLEEKRENSLALKKELSGVYGFAHEDGTKRPWDGLRLTIPGEVQDRMERGLITAGDVREAVWRAEQAGEGFVGEDGQILCSLDGGAVVYWVRYRREADSGGACFAVSSVYAHRMRVREGG